MSPDDEPASDGDPALVERFQSMLMDSWRSQALCVAASLGLADLLADAPRTSADLASATGADPAALHRLLRALGTIDVCRERDDGRFELTAFGSLLRESASN